MSADLQDIFDGDENYDGVIYCLLSAMMYLFLGGGGAGQGAEIVMRGVGVISLVYRVNMLCIADVIIYTVYVGRVVSRRPCGERCLPDGTETSHTFSLFFILTMSVFLDVKHLVVDLLTMAFLRI